MEIFKRTAEVFRYIEKNYSNPTALNYYRDGKWHHVSTKTFVDNIKRLTLDILFRHSQRGYGRNPCPALADWSIADIAIMLSGGVCVPLFSNISDDNFTFEVNQTQLKVLFVAGQDSRAMYEKHKNLFETVILLEDDEPKTCGITFQETLHLEDKLREKQPDQFDTLIDACEPEGSCHHHLYKRQHRRAKRMWSFLMQTF